jgi:hypothetical protein
MKKNREENLPEEPEFVDLVEEPVCRLLPPETFDRAEIDNDIDYWAFNCDGEPVEVRVTSAGVFLNDVQVYNGIEQPLLYACKAFGEFEFLGVLGDFLGIAMLTYFKGTNMVHHIAGPRVNAAASIGLYLREDGWGDAVTFLPVLKTTEEKVACVYPVYYNQKAPYGVFKRLDVVPEVHGEDVLRGDA